ncbi:MAG TPA: ferritin-like domain-containing protein [Clostridiales bacterium]|nr:ferritin-like domain-containing protein [Clostridiales bacterium]
MDVQNIINKLNWFYMLELMQVDSYINQSRLSKNPQICHALERFAYIEQQHANNIRHQLARFGAKPNPSATVIPPWIGRIVGKTAPAMGEFLMLRLNISIEQKAKSDYLKFIDGVRDPYLLKMLWSHYIDEDLHATWMAKKSRQCIFKFIKPWKTVKR